MARVVICTTDKDLMQCVRGTRVVVMDRIRGRVTDEAEVRARFGVAPASLPDFFALVGDPSDGLPGVPRWGAKAAAALLDAYGRVEAIPPDASEWRARVRGAEALARSLRAHRREACLMRDLSLLRTDLPLGENVDDLAWRGPDPPGLRALVARVGGEEVLGRLPQILEAKGLPALEEGERT